MVLQTIMQWLEQQIMTVWSIHCFLDDKVHVSVHHEETLETVDRSPSMLVQDCHRTKAGRGLVNMQREGLRSAHIPSCKECWHLSLSLLCYTLRTCLHDNLNMPKDQSSSQVCPVLILWNCICENICHGKNIWEKTENPAAVFVTVWWGLKCADPRGIMKGLLKDKAALLNITNAFMHIVNLKKK